MKQRLGLALLALLLSACSDRGESHSDSQPGETNANQNETPQTAEPEAPPQKNPADPNQPVLVATIRGVQENLDFRRNVQLMRNSRDQVTALKTALDNESNPAKKQEIEDALQTALAKLNENNRTMLKTYGYSITNRYQMVVDKAQVLMELTEADVEASKKKDPDFDGEAGSFKPLVTIEGAEANENYQRNVQLMTQRRNAILKAQKAAQTETDSEKKQDLQNQIKQAVEQLDTLNKQMYERYRYTLNRNYQYAIETSRVFRLPDSRKDDAL